MIINNSLGMSANRNLKKVSTTKQKSSEKLSSGKRITKSSNDASGLAISSKLRAQIRGLDQASRNIQDGSSLVQTADGGMAEIHNMLHRQRGLTIQAMNDTNTSEDREKIQLEINELVEEIDNICDVTDFNGIKPLKSNSIGSSSVVANGVNEPNWILGQTFPIGNFSVGESFTVIIEFSNINPPNSMDRIDLELDSPSTSILMDSNDYSENTSSSLANKITFSGMYSNPQVFTVEGIKEGHSGEWSIRNFDLGNPTSFDFKISVLGKEQDDSISLQVGSNANQMFEVSKYNCTSKGLEVRPLIIDPYEEAVKSLNKINSATDKVSTYRANCGAELNALNSINNSVLETSINLSSANSKIKDTDMAKEMMNIVKANVIQKASTSILLLNNSMNKSNVKALLE